MTLMMMIDTHSVAVTAAQGLGLLRSFNFSIADQISSMIQPYDAVAPPPVKPNPHRIRRRNQLRRKRRTKRKLSDDGYRDERFFFGDDAAGGGGGGGFGGGGGGGGSGGGGWNFDRFGDESSSSVPDPAFDFVYQNRGFAKGSANVFRQNPGVKRTMIVAMLHKKEVSSDHCIGHERQCYPTTPRGY